jgi:hypothetical protein
MLKYFNWILIGGLIILLFMQCKSKPELEWNPEQNAQDKTTDINPNGSSELAILMRKMHDDGMEMKKQIINGGNPENVFYKPGILTADPTDSAQVGTMEYNTFAQSYLSISNEFGNMDQEGQKKKFNQIVTTCLTCHQEVCPGPMVKIKKLMIK